MTTDSTPPEDHGWHFEAEAAIAAAARDGLPFQAADLGPRYGLPDPPHPSMWGRAFAAAHARGDIRPVGATQSTRRTVNRSLVMVWVGGSGTMTAAEAS